MSAARVQVKRVPAFPIPVQIQEKGVVIPGNIVKLNQSSCLIETVRNLPLGMNYQLIFSLPVLGTAVTCTGVVVKGYTRFGGIIEGTKSNALSEVQIKQLPEEAREAIVDFLSQIRRGDKKE